MDILTGKKIRLLQWVSFIGQFVYPVEGEGMGYRVLMGGIIILASCEYQFNKVHENLVQHPSNNISINK